MDFSVPEQSTQRPSTNDITATNQSESSTGNGFRERADSSNEDIQRKMKDVIDAFQFNVNTDPIAPRKSVTTNNANETIVDPPRSRNSSFAQQTNQPATSSSTQHDGSLSKDENDFKRMIQAINQPVVSNNMNDEEDPEPIAQPLNYNDEDDEESFGNKVNTGNNDEGSTSVMKQHVLDETTQFSTTTPSRAASVSSKKQPASATPDEVNSILSTLNKRRKHCLFRHQYLVMKNVRI